MKISFRFIRTGATFLQLSALATPSVHAQPAARVAPPMEVKLPFPPGARHEVEQGNHGKFSHNDVWNRFAWDFPMKIGTPITAAAAGTVVDVKEDSARGGKSKQFADDANYVEIDHGGSRYSVYMHVAQGSVNVTVGDVVQAGDLIAKSGNNGFSTSPHLHFTVTDAAGHSQPSYFSDFPKNKGVPREGDQVESGTPGRRERVEESRLPRDAFAKNGIRLTSDLPERLWRPREEYRVSGRVDGWGKRVVIFVMGHDGGDALREYFGDVGPGGRFDFSFRLFAPEKRWEKNPHAFEIAMARVRPDGSYQSPISVPITIYRER
jgi:murein DD-endopeptidase MepM/ murein hydrolase activator NlpD